MKRRVTSLILLFTVAATLSSCSYFNWFAVVNNSGSPVEVQYKLKEGEAAEGVYRLDSKPAKKSAADLEDYDKEWRELQPEEFSFDEKLGLVTVTLQPDEALSIYMTSNYTVGSEADSTSFPLAALRLNGVRGTTQYVGEQARLQFKELSTSIYTVTYY